LEAKKELESEAKKWQNNVKTNRSKIKIGNCPTGSTWGMGNGYDECFYWGNKVPAPAECNSITPKIISDYKGNECEY